MISLISVSLKAQIARLIAPFCMLGFGISIVLQRKCLIFFDDRPDQLPYEGGTITSWRGQALAEPRPIYQVVGYLQKWNGNTAADFRVSRFNDVEFFGID